MSSTVETETNREQKHILKQDKLTWNFKRNWPLYAMLLPALVNIFIFQYLPLPGLIIAFQDFKPWLGFMKSPFVGLQHFKDMFLFPDSQQVVWNTLIIALLKMITGIVAPITMALLLNELRKMFFKRALQTIVYLPHFLSWVILGGILIDMLSTDGGMVNRTIGLFGIEPIFFLGNGDWFRVTIIISDVWKETGFGTIIFLAALSGINPNLYEAAEVDGATRLKQTLHITLPSLIPITIVVGTLSLGNILNAGFDQIFNLYNPLVYDKADIIDTYVYRIGILGGSFSFAAAVGMFKSVISFVLIVGAYSLAYRFANYRIF